MIDYTLTNAAYHSGTALSNSGLTDLAQSPAHFWSKHRDADRPPRTTKPGQLEGTLAHSATLEPNDFTKHYVIGPDVNKNTNEWKAFVKASEAGGRIVISQAQAEVAFAQAYSVRKLPDVAALLEKGYAEVSAFWTDEETQVACRCRPDWVHPIDEKRVILVDLKTCGDAGPREFAKQIDRKGYARQAAFYTDGYAQAAGVEVVGFVFVAIESTWPYAAAAYLLQPEWIEAARGENRRLLRTYADCMASGIWPGYSDAITLLDLPPHVARAAND